ncbi:hypothetical protein SAMN04489842_3511 [Natronobacterium texcoconense]|uniref:Uncharacterized protein n=1 Tax=Natronobacterium texcoconense TaxID=1095778 RepID=A0A1H1IFE3_NATTX|nr:hypothetical protein SAMN04489842_3511 [Natronobacterium texcoconense]
MFGFDVILSPENTFSFVVHDGIGSYTTETARYAVCPDRYSRRNSLEMTARNNSN